MRAAQGNYSHFFKGKVTMVELAFLVISAATLQVDMHHRQSKPGAKLRKRSR